jgi:competence protein ComEA
MNRAEPTRFAPFGTAPQAVKMKTPSLSIGIAACVLIASTLMAAAPSSQSVAPQPSVSPADDPAAGLFSEMCSRCHEGARITAVRRTKSEWEQVLTKMIVLGATGSEDDFESVFGYLRRHYGKVYINTATPDEITTSLGLSTKDADAVVAYRKANGSFADFDGLKKVPDIDLKTLEAQRDAVAF